jgi:hypothetical protein
MKLAEQIVEARSARTPTRLLGDGRQLWLYRMLFTWRLAIGPANEFGYENFWCYEGTLPALRAFVEWDPLNPETPEPGGWTKHKPTGRIRPDGDPTRERLETEPE